jgi:GNAT superfamily N-acetyltransferase
MHELQEPPELQVRPLTQERWADFETLFGLHGAFGGCWCMWWRLKRTEFERQQGEGNKSAMRAIVESGEVPGLLAYLQERPVAWCSVAPREQFPVLQRSRVLKPVDDLPAWSIVCLFVEKSFRKQGVATGLLHAALDYVREQGGRAVEAYPVEPRVHEMPDYLAYTGVASTFQKMGFVEVARRSERRLIMRYCLEPDQERGGTG